MQKNKLLNCYVCGKRKREDEISLSKNNPCKVCKSHANRWLRFGLSPWRYGELLEEQKKQCAICGIVFTETGRAKAVIDHCHKTKMIRGVLCVKCNTGIGQLRDSSQIVKAALNYLENKKRIKPDFQGEVYTLLRFYFMGDKVAEGQKEKERLDTCEMD